MKANLQISKNMEMALTGTQTVNYILDSLRVIV
jgi:hypothetical protein